MVCDCPTDIWFESLPLRYSPPTFAMCIPIVTMDGSEPSNSTDRASSMSIQFGGSMLNVLTVLTVLDLKLHFSYRMFITYSPSIKFYNT